MADTSIYTDPTSMDKANVQLSIWNGTKWVELSNGYTINQINTNIHEVADKVAEAQQGIAQATTDAQNAVDTANTAITQAGLATDTATTAKQVADSANSVATQAQTDSTKAQSDAQTALTTAQTASSDVATVSSDLDTTKANLQTVSDLATQNTTDINTTNSTVSGIKTDLANTQGDVTELKTTASGLETDVTNAKGDISQLKQSATTMQSNIKDNTDNISSVTQTATGLTADMKDAKGNISTLQNSVNGLNSTVSTVQTTANTNKTNISSLSNTVSGLNSTVSSLSTDNTTNKTNISSLQNTASGLTTSISSLQSDNSTNKINISSLQQTASGITSNVTSLQTQVNNSAVGTNLISGSTLEKNWYAQSPATASLDAINLVTFTKSTTSSARQAYMHTTQSGFLPSQYYTLSAEIYIVSVSGSGTDNDIHFRSYGSNSAATGNYVALLDTSKVSVWQKLVVTGKTPSDVSGGLDFGLSISGSTTGVFKIRNFKLEKGSTATDWSANPADNATVTALSSVKQEADAISSTVTANKTSSDSQFSTINQTISGIQSTVSNKADSSTVTQLATLVNSKVNSSDYNSEITQLASDINLRVKTGDLLSQINQQAGGNTLIQVSSGKGKLYLDSSTVVFSGNAFIPSANIASISADKITTGTMTAGAINLGNGTFKVDTSGNLTANNANLTGTLTSGSSSYYNYEVSGDGILFRYGTNAFAKLEGLALNNWNYASLASDAVTLGRSIPSEVVSGKVSYISTSTEYGVTLNRVNGYDNNAESTITVGSTPASGSDVIKLTTLNGTKSAESSIEVYGYDAKNNKDTEYIELISIDSSSNSSYVNISPTEILLNTPNSDLIIDNSVSKAVTLTTSEPNGIQFSTSVGYISMNAKTELDLTAKTNINVSSASGNLTLQSNGKFNINAMDGTSILAFDTNASSGWIYANNLLWAKTALRTSYLWVEGKADISGVVNCQSVNQTSLLSKKTNITKLDTQDVINAVNSTEIYEYSYKNDLEQGVSKRYASYIIDDVNEVAQYNEPSEFLSEDKQGRDDGTLLAYLTVMVQEMYKEIQELKNK